MPWDYIAMTFLMLTGVFLMIVVLLQRGRGGGLAGAFGGAGGQSAFGTKAGDVFTKITVVIAVVWVILAGTSGFVLRAGARHYDELLKDERLKKESAMSVAPDAPVAGAKEDLEPEKGKTEEPPLKKKGKKATQAGEKQDNSPADTKPPTGKDAGDKTEADPGNGPKIPKKPKSEGSP